jgi:hypothetical protein
MTDLPEYEYLLENILAEVSSKLDYTRLKWQPQCGRRAGKTIFIYGQLMTTT